MTDKWMSMLRVGLVCVFSVSLAGAASADVDIQRLTLARDGIMTVLTIQAPGRLLSNHFIEEPKDGRPFRIVLDICGAIHRLQQKDFADLPTKTITRIRTSQYATTPQNVVRVVLDLSGEMTYKVSLQPETIQISLIAPGELEFASWSSSAEPGQSYAGQHSSTVSTPPEISAPKPATPEAPKNEGRDQQNRPTIASSHAPFEEAAPSVSPDNKQDMITAAPATTSAEKHVEVVAIEPPRESTAEKWAAAKSTAVTSAPAEQIWAPAPEKHIQEPATRPTEAAIAGQQPSPESSSGAVVQYPLLVGPEPVGQTSVRSAIPEDQSGTTPEQQQKAPMVADVPSESTPLPSGNQPVTESPQLAQQSAPAADENVPLLERLKRKFFGGPGEEKVEVSAGVDSSLVLRIRELAPAVAEQPEEQSAADTAWGEVPPPAAFDREALVDKIASVDPSIIGTSQAATDSGIAGEMLEPQYSDKGVQLSLEGARTEVIYERVGRRDPFDPLMEGQRSGLWTSSLPRADALRLVGILEDFDGTVALFEDMEGYGYILHEGDPVRNGEVKLIGKNRVVFQIDDYGWVHTITLDLQEEAAAAEPDLATEEDEHQP